MPLTRYFLFVGVALLALLLVATAFMPTLPLGEIANSNRPAIRIHADPKWPERVVFDTDRPAIVPRQTASTENTENNTPDPPATVAEVPAGTREALAQLQPSSAVQSHPPAARKREARQHQRRPAIRRVAPYEFRMARQTNFGWFGYSTW
jgi:hypothetical protein